jgi:hypothetical protein
LRNLRRERFSMATAIIADKPSFRLRRAEGSWPHRRWSQDVHTPHVIASAF